MSVAAQIEQRLKAKWPESDLTVIDESHKHAGHAGAPDGGESHFHVKLTTAAFAELSLVDRHRAVNGELADLLAGPIHALRLSLKPA